MIPQGGAICSINWGGKIVIIFIMLIVKIIIPNVKIIVVMIIIKLLVKMMITIKRMIIKLKEAKW